MSQLNMGMFMCASERKSRLQDDGNQDDSETWMNEVMSEWGWRSKGESAPQPSCLDFASAIRA